MEPRWWPFAVRFFAAARNFENRDDGSPYFKRHGEPFKGQLLPFGCLVDFFPVAPKPRREKDETNTVTRIHRKPRYELFDPRGTKCPVSVDILENIRDTRIACIDGDHDIITSEDWREMIDPREDAGETCFRIAGLGFETWNAGDEEEDSDYEPEDNGDGEDVERLLLADTWEKIISAPCGSRLV